jgi:hypothetical protein
MARVTPWPRRPDPSPYSPAYYRVRTGKDPQVSAYRRGCNCGTRCVCRQLRCHPASSNAPTVSVITQPPSVRLDAVCHPQQAPSVAASSLIVAGRRPGRSTQMGGGHEKAGSSAGDALSSVGIGGRRRPGVASGVYVPCRASATHAAVVSVSCGSETYHIRGVRRIAPTIFRRVCP